MLLQVIQDHTFYPKPLGLDSLDLGTLWILEMEYGCCSECYHHLQWGLGELFVVPFCDISAVNLKTSYTNWNK